MLKLFAQLSWAHSETSSSFLLLSISAPLCLISLSFSLGLIISTWSPWVVLHQKSTMNVQTPPAMVPIMTLLPYSIIIKRKVITTTTYHKSSLTIQMSIDFKIYTRSFKSEFCRNLHKKMIIINYPINETNETPPTYQPKVKDYLSSRASFTFYFSISSAEYFAVLLLRLVPDTSYPFAPTESCFALPT